MKLLPRLKTLPAWWIVPAVALIGALAGGIYGTVRAPQYSATAYVLVVPTAKSDPTTALGFAQAYGRIAPQVAIAGDAAARAGVSQRTLKNSVQTATSPDAPMISVSATAPRATTAVKMADGVAGALVQNGGHLQSSTNVRVVHFSRAVEPTTPASPSAPLAGLVGACAGGLLGGLALLVRPRHRNTGPLGTAPGPTLAAAAQPQPETV